MKDKQIPININNKEYYCDIEVLKLIERLQDKIELLEYNRDKAIELLEKENYHCPMSLTVEKAYIIEVEKINNVISILKEGENNE